MIYARMQDGLVAELIHPVADVPIDEQFTAEIVAQLVEVPEGAAVRPGDGFNGTVFVHPVVSLDSMKADQIRSINGACQATIYGGFTSSALGAAHSYPANDHDQQNLTASVLASLMPGNAADWTTPFWCADPQGAWAFVAHTAAQIQQVGRDGKTAILTAMAKSQSLVEQVNAATTGDAVQAIVW